MSVYVDSANLSYGRMIMCHMLADSTDELLTAVDKLGVKRRWLQSPGTYREHFDICLAKRKLAVENGAIQITTFELGKLLAKRRKAAQGAAKVFNIGTNEP